MIRDQECDLVYLSDLLETRCPEFYHQLIQRFERARISYKILKGTKDLWVRDFMPIQVTDDMFVQYKYDPDYLRSGKYQRTESDPVKLLKTLGIIPHNAGIILDGGNIVKSETKVIITSKICKENPDWPGEHLTAEIKHQLRVKQVILIPREPGDWLGHADGIVRFVDEDTVLINRYPKNRLYQEFDYALRCCLMNAGLRIIDFPYTAWQNQDSNEAAGCYINFLEVGNYIFYPVYAQLSDQITELVLKNAFPDRELIAIDCRDLAKLGGVLNCITWTIKTL